MAGKASVRPAYRETGVGDDMALQIDRERAERSAPRQPRHSARPRRDGRGPAVAVLTVTLLVALLVPRAATSTAVAADLGPPCTAAWPAGPAGIVAFSLPAGRLCWTSDLPQPWVYDHSLSDSRPVAIVGGVAFTTVGTPNHPTTLVARDAVTGTPRWRATVSDAWRLPRAPRADGGLVIVPAEGPGAVVARDLSTGEERWRATLASPTGRTRQLYAIVETADTVFVSVGEAGYLDDPTSAETAAIDRVTGAERYRRGGTMAAANEHVAVAAVVGSAGWSFVPLDPLTGALRERPRVEDERWGLIGLVGEVLVGFRWEDPVELFGIDTGTGALRWRRGFEPETRIMPVGFHGADSGTGQILVQRLVSPPPLGTAPSATLTAYDAATGELRWERPGLNQVLGRGPGAIVISADDSGVAPAGDTVRVLDAATGATQSTLELGPWRSLPITATVGSGVVAIARAVARSWQWGPGQLPTHCSAAGDLQASGSTAAGDDGGELTYQAIPPPAAAAYVPLPPTRLFDSRDAGTGGFQCRGERLTFRVTGQAGIPADGVTAVALNVTVAGSGGAGFVTTWPAGEAQPLASTLNLTGSAQTRSNFVILPVAPDGFVSLVTQAGGHVLADVSGYFAARSTSSEGRIVPLAPRRLLDTRTGPGAPLPDSGSVTVPVAGVGAAAPAGAAAAVVTLTATETAAEGFVTAWPSGSPRPLAASLNVDGANQTVANLAIVPLGSDGAFSLFAQRSTHLVVDLVAYVTGPDAPSSSTGLFVPVLPARVFDTRRDVGLVPGGWSVSPPHTGVAGIPADAAAAFLNVTGVGSTAVTHVRVWPAGTSLPLASSLNLAPQDTRAAATLMATGVEGRISYFNAAGTLSLVADAMGYVLP